MQPLLLVKIEKVFESISNGTSVVKACKAANIERKSFYVWLGKDPKNRERYYAVLSERCQAVEDSLYKKAINGDVTACIFWLKNRAPDQWKDRVEKDIYSQIHVKTNEEIATEVSQILGINLASKN